MLDSIKMHVDAKRYLCRASAGYFAKLSEDSKRSLTLQGGVFSAQQAAAFLAQGSARNAVMLRQWDDLAKQADLTTPSLAHFLRRAERCALARTAIHIGYYIALVGAYQHGGLQRAVGTGVIVAGVMALRFG